jgi:hypothetical protein
MHKLLIASTFAILLSFAATGAAEARGWNHQGTITTPRGTTTTQSSGSCAGGTCTRQGSATGPAGRSVSHQGTTQCAGGKCSSTGTFTGPNGGVATRQGSAQCAGGTCSSSGAITGPNGRSASRSGASTVTPN